MFRRVVVCAVACAGLALVAAGSAGATDHVVFDSLWGGHGVITDIGRTNLCRMHRIEPGSSRPAEIKTDASGHQVGSGPHSLPGTLLCAPALDIWAHTSGPWDPDAPGGPNWLSIRCPDGEQPINGGAGAAVPNHRSVTQVAGGFGHGHDGYWHYKFHNWSEFNVRIQFWAVCVRRGRA